jgi:hypothetical protein
MVARIREAGLQRAHAMESEGYIRDNESVSVHLLEGDYQPMVGYPVIVASFADHAANAAARIPRKTVR